MVDDLGGPAKHLVGLTAGGLGWLLTERSRNRCQPDHRGRGSPTGSQDWGIDVTLVDHGAIPHELTW